MSDIDIKFTEWVKLYKDDPVKFEQFKNDQIEKQLTKIAKLGRSEEYIENLRRMLWRRNQELNKHTNPTCRFNRLVELLFEDNQKLATSLKMISDPDNKSEPIVKASVIPFNKNK